MKLIAFKYGETEIDKAMAFRDGDKNEKLRIDLLFFMLEEGQRKILIDVGCDTMKGFRLIRHEKPVEVLRRSGYSPDEIDSVLITHAHNDHIGAVNYYKNATVYINKLELDESARFIKEPLKIVTFDDSLLITERIEMRKIGGHTRGSSVVLVHTDSSNLVLCGDECYLEENLKLKIPTGSSVSPEHSLAFVREYSAQAYTPIIFHSTALVGELGARVIFEE